MIRVALHGQLRQAEKYLEMFQDLPHFIISGIFPTDQNLNLAGEMTDQPAPLIFNEEDLIKSSDIILFLSFKSSDFLILKRALKESKHIFINPAHILYPEIISHIHKLGEEAGVYYYIKHKNLNPRLQEILDNSYDNLEFIDVYTYVPSDLELNESILRRIISKEILFIFSVNNHEIKKYKIKTVPYCSNSPFIINIRFDFTNSSTANLTFNFFTPNSARFAELYYSNNLLRINSKDGEVEFIAPEKNSYNVIKKNYSINSETDATPEITSFLGKISISGKTEDYRSSGLFAHELIWNVLNDISSTKKSSV